MLGQGRPVLVLWKAALLKEKRLSRLEVARPIEARRRQWGSVGLAGVLVGSPGERP